MTDETLVTYEIGIAIDGQPSYVVSVPTSLGREAAERRARYAIMRQHPDVKLDRITVCKST